MSVLQARTHLVTNNMLVTAPRILIWYWKEISFTSVTHLNNLDYMNTNFRMKISISWSWLRNNWLGVALHSNTKPRPIREYHPNGRVTPQIVHVSVLAFSNEQPQQVRKVPVFDTKNHFDYFKNGERSWLVAQKDFRLDVGNVNVL